MSEVVGKFVFRTGPLAIARFWLRRVLITGLTASVLLTSVAVSFAVPLQFVDCVDSTNGTTSGIQAVAAATCSASPSTNDLFFSPTGTTALNFTHSINDNGFLPTDIITSATLVIDFRDDGGAMDGGEQVDVFIDFNGNGLFTDAGEQVANDVNAMLDFACTAACNTALVTALSDGVTALRLALAPTGGQQDFFFVDSLLTVNVERVPVPPVLLLLASAGTVLGAVRAWRTGRRW